MKLPAVLLTRHRIKSTKYFENICHGSTTQRYICTAANTTQWPVCGISNVVAASNVSIMILCYMNSYNFRKLSARLKMQDKRDCVYNTRKAQRQIAADFHEMEFPISILRHKHLMSFLLYTVNVHK